MKVTGVLADGIARTLTAAGYTVDPLDTEGPGVEVVVRSDRRTIHDLRGALAVMSGQVEMLEEGIWGPLNEDQARTVASIGRQVVRLSELVEAVRTGAR